MKSARRLEDLKNIGPAMAGWLRAAGIATPEQVQELGAIECYLRIRPLEPRVINRMALYALYGAIHDENCLWLSPDVKEMLNAMLDDAERTSTTRR